MQARGAWLLVAGLIARNGDGKSLSLIPPLSSAADIAEWMRIDPGELEASIAELHGAGLLIVEPDRWTLPDRVGGIRFRKDRRWRVV